MTGLVADRRVHPGTIGLRFLREAPQTLLALPAGLAFVSQRGLTGALWVAGGIAIIGLFVHWLHWHRFRYGIGPHEIVIERGILHRTRREIPFDRIQDVDIERALLARLFGLAKVRIETGAGGKDEGVLDSVSAEEAARLRAAVRSWQAVGGAAADAPPPAEAESRAIFAMALPRVLLSGLFGFSLVYLGGLFALLQTFDAPLKRWLGLDIYDATRWLGLARGAAERQLSAGTIASLLIVAILLSAILSALGVLGRDYGFRLSSEGNRFRRERGLLTRSEAVIAKRRIQLAYVETGPLRRLFGWFRLSFQTLGAGTDGSGHQVAAPFARAEELAPIVAETRLRLPAPEEMAMVSRRHIVRALLRNLLLPVLAIGIGGLFWRPALLFAALLPFLGLTAILARRFHRFGLTADLLFVRRGVWRQRLFAIPVDRVQALSLTRSWLQRRLGLATVEIDTAGAAAMRSPRIVDLSESHARRLAAEIADRAFAAGFNGEARPR